MNFFKKRERKDDNLVDTIINEMVKNNYSNYKCMQDSSGRYNDTVTVYNHTFAVNGIGILIAKSYDPWVSSVTIGGMQVTDASRKKMRTIYKLVSVVHKREVAKVKSTKTANINSVITSINNN